GRIDDSTDPEKVTRHDLADALDSILAGRPVATAQTSVVGCVIAHPKPARPAAKGTVTYSHDVASILARNCVACHRQGEGAPFSLATYREARIWAQQIKYVTAQHIMPPWKPVPGYGDFHDARAVTPREVQLLARWADDGAPLGDAKLVPKPPQFPTGWALGQPDIVIRPKSPYHLAAEGRDIYRCFALPVEFKQDAYLTAAQIRPDNRAVVHHIIVYVDTSGKCAALDKGDGFNNPTPGASPPVPDARILMGWAPGNTPRPFDPGVCGLIPKGARLVMEVHYHRSLRPEVDRSAI